MKGAAVRKNAAAVCKFSGNIWLHPFFFFFWSCGQVN